MTHSRIDLNRLHIFRTIILAGNLTKAAVQLGLPKSKVSRQLAALEEEVGCELVFRTTRQLQLTPVGKELLQSALPHLSELEGALERIAQGSEEVSGRLRVTVPDDMGTVFMGGIVSTFMSMYPKVLLEVHVTNQKLDLIRDSFDLALRIGKLKDSTLVQRKIGNIRLSPYISPELKARSSLVEPHDLASLPHLAFTTHLDPKNAMLRLHRSGDSRTVKTEVAFASNSFFVLRDLAARGRGFTMLPAFVAEDALRRNELIPALREWSAEGQPVHLVTPHQRDIPVRARKFIEHLQTEMKSILI